MATKTITFKFIKKVKLKFSKETPEKKSGKKKLLGLQLMSFNAKESYHLAPVKIVKNDLIVNKKGNDIEVEGSLKFKVNIKDQFVSNFNNSVKEKSLTIRLLGFNTEKIAGWEIAIYEFPNPKKTNDFLEVL